MPILEHTGHRGLAVDSGDLVSVLGAPGSGKTRLAFELAFLMRPDEGEVLFHGVNPLAGRRGSLQRPRGITMLVQNAEDQLFARTVYDDVAFAPRHLSLSEDQIEDRVTRALQTVRLDPDEVRDRSPFALSGGERRRAALAGVLAMEPEVLILDEPTSNLDPQTRETFLDLLAPLRGKSAIVWLTSRAREAALADRIYLFRDGQTVEIPSGPELLGDWRQLARAGIELPPVYELAEALERRGCRLPAASSSGDLRQAIIDDWQTRHDR